MEYNTPTTELEAVNTMLSVMGEAPVATLEDIEALDAAVAHNVLKEVSRSVQARGWHWNREANVPMTPDAITGEVTVGTDVLRADVAEESWSVSDLLMRGQRIYDKTNRTYVFTATVYLDTVILLPFTDLPEAARQYITIRAARTNQLRQLGSVTVQNFTDADEDRALAELEAAEADTADYNILTGGRQTARMYLNKRP